MLRGHERVSRGSLGGRPRPHQSGGQGRESAGAGGAQGGREEDGAGSWPGPAESGWATVPSREGMDRGAGSPACLPEGRWSGRCVSALKLPEGWWHADREGQALTACRQRRGVLNAWDGRVNSTVGLLFPSVSQVFPTHLGCLLSFFGHRLLFLAFFFPTRAGFSCDLSAV